MTKEEAIAARSAWARAIEEVAREVGKESPVYRALGSAAWGRYEHEPQRNDSKDGALLGLGYLEGLRYGVMLAARANNWEGERALANVPTRVRAILGGL